MCRACILARSISHDPRECAKKGQNKESAHHAVEDDREHRWDHRVELTGDEPQLSYAVTASALEMSDAAVKVAVHRLRKKFRDVVRDEIAQTVASPADIEDELRHLWSAVRR